MITFYKDIGLAQSCSKGKYCLPEGLLAPTQGVQMTLNPIIGYSFVCWLPEQADGKGADSW